MTQILSFFIVLFLLIFSGSIIIKTIQNGISPMPTAPKVLNGFLKTLPQNLQGQIFELGSGWGTLAFSLSKALPDSQIHAYENSFFPYLFSKSLSLLQKKNNLHFHFDDFFQVPLKEASLVTCYLYPDAMERLGQKLEQELNPNCVVICHTFAIPRWKAEKVIEIEDLYRSKIYVYSMKSIRSKTLGIC